MPGDSLQRGAGDFNQSCDDDKDVDGRPAYDEDGNHHQNHAGDPTQVSVLLLCVCVCEGGRGFSVGDKWEHEISVDDGEDTGEWRMKDRMGRKRVRRVMRGEVKGRESEAERREKG